MSLLQEGSSRLNRRQAVRALTLVAAAPVAAHLANELGFLPDSTPTVEAIAGFKDVYHTDSMTINPHTNEIHSVITVNGRNFISIGKISEGRLGQTVQQMTNIDLDADPKKLIVNPNRNKNSIRISESGQRLDISRDFDDRPLFLPIHANKAINFDRDGDVAVVNGDRRMLLIDVNNPSFREVTRSTQLEYNSFSKFTKDQSGTLNAFAGSAEGLKSLKIDSARREISTTVDRIPGVSGEVSNVKTVTLPGNREGLVFSNGRKAFVVDAQDPTRVIQSVDITFNAGDAQIKGLAVNKTTGELAVSVWSQSQQKTVIEGYTNGAQTTRMERFLDAAGHDTRELKRETEVEFIYDEKENNRGYLIAMSFQGVFRADGRKFSGPGGELGKVIPLADPNGLIPVEPTATPRPTNTAQPTPTATPKPTNTPEPPPTATPIIVTPDKDYVIHHVDAFNGELVAIVQKGSNRMVARLNNGALESVASLPTLNGANGRIFIHGAGDYLLADGEYVAQNTFRTALRRVKNGVVTGGDTLSTAFYPKRLVHSADRETVLVCMTDASYFTGKVRYAQSFELVNASTLGHSKLGIETRGDGTQPMAFTEISTDDLDTDGSNFRTIGRLGLDDGSGKYIVSDVSINPGDLVARSSDRAQMRHFQILGHIGQDPNRFMMYEDETTPEQRYLPVSVYGGFAEGSPITASTLNQVAAYDNLNVAMYTVSFPGLVRDDSMHRTGLSVSGEYPGKRIWQIITPNRMNNGLLAVTGSTTENNSVLALNNPNGTGSWTIAPLR